MKFTILFRSVFDIGLEDEVEGLRNIFHYCDSNNIVPVIKDNEDVFLFVNSRTHQECQNALVIARYSCLPYYKELCDDLALIGSRLINSLRQHNYIADMMEWQEDLKGLTPQTWEKLEYVPIDIGPVVLKGKTNSRKHLWDTHMFAKDRAAATDVMIRLQDDSLISSQTIYVRKFVPLKTFFISLHGLPITEEYRFFVYKKHVIASGFYWSSHVYDFNGNPPDPKVVPKEFLDDVIRRIGDNAVFYVIDVARKEDGNWIVIEINDGQMSGLSECDPVELYSNLKNELIMDVCSYK